MLPVLLFSISGSILLKRIISQELDRSLNSITMLIEQNIRKTMNSSLSDMQWIMQSIDKEIVPAMHIPDFLELTIQKNSLLQSLMVLDPQGKVIYTPTQDDSLLGNDYSRFDFFDTPGDNTGIYWSSTFILPQTSEITLALSVKGNNQHTYVGFFALNELQQEVIELGKLSQREIGIINENRTYIAHSDFTRVRQRQQEQAFDPQNPPRNMIYQGRRRILYVKALEDIQFYIILMDNFYHHYAPVFAAIAGYSILALIIFLIVFIYVSTQSRKLSYHLENLVKSSASIIQGDYDINTPLSNYREINHLISNFNLMASTIRQALEESFQSRKAQEELNVTLKSQMKKIRENEQQLQMIMDFSYDGILFLNPDLKIIRISSSMMRIFNIPGDPESMKGNYCYDIFNDSQVICKDCTIRSLYNDNKNLQEPKSKVIHWNEKSLEANIYPVIEKDRLKGTIITYRDITQRLLMERQLNQSIKMEAIGRLAGGIAHDFNNILQVIFGYSDLLYQLSKENESSDYIRNIIETGERAEKLVQQLMAFCRMEDKEKEVLVLDSTINRVFDMLQRLTGDTMILKLELNTPDSRILGDNIQLEQILVNLVVNAKDAMNGKGTLYIRTYLKNQDSTNWVIMEVEDNGPGIPVKIQEKIFDPFFSTKDVGKGTGMGLATVFGIVKNHGGMIHLESTHGAGALFQIRFPLYEKPYP